MIASGLRGFEVGEIMGSKLSVTLLLAAAAWVAPVGIMAVTYLELA